MILQNEAKCLKCGDQIFSAHRHDYKKCSCGNLGVDGGMAYIRRTFQDYSTIEEKSIDLDDDACNAIKEALEWTRENHRNDLGALCAIVRGLRDAGYEIRKKEE